MANPEAILAALEKLLPSGLSDAELIAARKAMTPEQSKQYLDLLKSSYGDTAERIKSVGIAQGRPKVTTGYHGSTVDIPQFEHQMKGSSTNAQSAKQGFFFAQDPSTASDYAQLAHEKGITPDVVETIRGGGLPGDAAVDLNIKQKKAWEDLGDAEDNFKNLVASKNYKISLQKGIDEWTSKSNESWMESAAKREGFDSVDKYKQAKIDSIKAKYAAAEVPSDQEILAAKQNYMNKISDVARIDPDKAKKQLSYDYDYFKNSNKDIASHIQNEMSNAEDYAQSGGQQVGKYKLFSSGPEIKDYAGEAYRDESYSDIMNSAFGNKNKDAVLFKNTYDPADPNNRVLQNIYAVKNPEQIRSVNAAFDPRYAKSNYILAGAGAVPAAGFQNPIDLGKKAMNFYQENVADPIKNAFINAQAGAFHQNPNEMRQDPLINTTSSIMTDPLSYVGFAQGGMASTNQDTVPVIDQTGQLGDIPREQLQDAVAQGYKVATPADVQNVQKEQKYGTPEEMAKTFGEGAANAATFGLFRQAQKALNVNPEGIIAREQVNPVTYGVGQMAGLLGSAALGVGEGAALERAGATASEMAGLGGQGASAVSKIGSAAVKGAVENMLFQGGDEVAKQAVSDPNQSLGSAMANMGIAGLIGGGIGGGLGVVSPLWEATTGGRLKSYLDLVKAKTNGEALPMATATQDALNHALESGFEIAPEMRASLSSDPEIQAMHAQLIDSSTKPGVNMLEARNKFFDAVQDHMMNTLGATPEYLASVAKKSDNQIASSIADDIVSNLKARIEPISEGYESFEKLADKMPLNKSQDIIVDKLAQFASENRLFDRGNAAEDAFKFLNKRLESAKHVIDIKDIIQDMQKFGSAALEDGSYGQYKGLRELMRGFQDEAVVKSLGSRLGPEELDKFNLSRVAYADMMKSVIDPLSERLAVGRYSGAKSFLSKLGDKFGERPEAILRKLNPKDDANMIALLQGEFPEVAAKVKQYHTDELLSKVANAKSPSKALNESMGKMSPEMRNWLFTDGQQKTINAMETIREQMASIPHNFSGTSKASESASKHAMAGAMSVAAALTGHSPIAGAMLGEAGRYLSKDAPAAMKLGFLKFLGSDAPTNSKGFAAMTNYLSSVYRGEAKSVQAVKSIFGAAKDVGASEWIDSKQHDKIDNRIEELQKDPEQMFDVGTDVAHYLPDHGALMSQTAANAVNYLNSIKPKPTKLSPLDKEIKPSREAVLKYERAIQVAHNPLSITHFIKNGTILPEDVQNLRAMYPGLYQNLSEKMVKEMSDIDHDETPIKYRTRQGLSLFLGTSLDSTLSPQGIQAAQSAFMAQSAQNQAAQQPQGKKANGTTVAKLGKVSQDYMTSNQAALSRQKA